MSENLYTLIILSAYVLGCVLIGLGVDPLAGLGTFFIIVARRIQES